jgi:hypothetical protein
MVSGAQMSGVTVSTSSYEIGPGTSMVTERARQETGARKNLIDRDRRDAAYRGGLERPGRLGRSSWRPPRLV